MGGLLAAAAAVSLACGEAQSPPPPIDEAVLGLGDVPPDWTSVPLTDQSLLGPEYTACAGVEPLSLAGMVERAESALLIGPSPAAQKVRSQAMRFQSDERATAALDALASGFRECGGALTRAAEAGFRAEAQARGANDIDELGFSAEFSEAALPGLGDQSAAFRMTISVGPFGVRGIQSYVLVRKGAVLGVMSYFSGPDDAAYAAVSVAVADRVTQAASGGG